MPGFLQISNLSCGYGKQFRINNINFTLQKGIFAGIIGPNGAGKSTLFKSIIGNLKPEKGNIILQYKNIYQISLIQKATMMAIVTQFNEFDDMSVEDYVLTGRIPYRKQFQFFETKNDIEIAEKYMKLANVYHLKHRNIRHLSGGEQQMVSIAKSLTQEPELLLLDEPTAHLDITHQIALMNLIQKLNTELNLTVLMIIHDLNIASEYCDYLLLMKKGTLYTQGTPEQVITYENIEAVYNTTVITKINPVTNKPVIFPVSQKTLARYKNMI